MSEARRPRRFRRARFGLTTALGIARRGVFIPYRRAATLDAPRWRAPYAAVEALFASREVGFREVLDLIEAQADALIGFGNAPPPAPRFAQDWFPRLDAAAAYALVRARRPKRIVEIGAGHSTRFLARAMRDERYGGALTTIDPAPRADLAGLAGVTLMRAPVQEVGLAPFEALLAGDLLFVDSSHVLMPGSDVDIVLNRVVPMLPAGVLVHLHDIFLPDDYPPEWRWRGYNEQQGVAPYLLGGRLLPLFASRYVATRMAGALTDTVIARLPLPEGAHESSLWAKCLR